MKMRRRTVRVSQLIFQAVTDRGKSLQLDKMVESIMAVGKILAPIVVEQVGEKFIVLNGNRRGRAAIIMGITNIEAMVFEDLTQDERDDITQVL